VRKTGFQPVEISSGGLMTARYSTLRFSLKGHSRDSSPLVVFNESAKYQSFYRQLSLTTWLGRGRRSRRRSGVVSRSGGCSRYQRDGVEPFSDRCAQFAHLLFIFAALCYFHECFALNIKRLVSFPTKRFHPGIEIIPSHGEVISSASRKFAGSERCHLAGPNLIQVQKRLRVEQVLFEIPRSTTPRSLVLVETGNDRPLRDISVNDTAPRRFFEDVIVIMKEGAHPKRRVRMNVVGDRGVRCGVLLVRHKILRDFIVPGRERGRWLLRLDR